MTNQWLSGCPSFWQTQICGQLAKNTPARKLSRWSMSVFKEKHKKHIQEISGDHVLTRFVVIMPGVQFSSIFSWNQCQAVSWTVVSNTLNLLIIHLRTDDPDFLEILAHQSRKKCHLFNFFGITCCSPCHTTGCKKSGVECHDHSMEGANHSSKM